MKISKKYVLWINTYSSFAIYGTKKLNARIYNIPFTMGYILDCSLEDLKYNIKFLKNNGINVYKYI